MQRTALAAAAAMALASTGHASAADFGYEPAPAPYVPAWQGFYIGAHGGMGEADFVGRGDLDLGHDFEDYGLLDSYGVEYDDGVVSLFRSTLNPDGLIVGGQAGYNWQSGSLVLGIEGDVSFADWSHNRTVFDTDEGDFFGPYEERAFAKTSADVEMLASIRGRLGMAFDNVLVYGTGGVAWADAKAGGRLYAEDAEGAVLLDESRSTKFDDLGFVAGGGLAWMVFPQTFSVGLEGLYYWFDQSETLYSRSFTYAPGKSVRASAKAELDDVWVVRARGDFHF